MDRADYEIKIANLIEDSSCDLTADEFDKMVENLIKHLEKINGEDTYEPKRLFCRDI